MEILWIVFFNRFMIIAVIPARLRSKRLLKKNIIDFYGKPLISYSIKVAKKAKIFDKIIVSSESDKIITIAKKYGACCPFKRPANLSKDKIWPSEVVKHAVGWIEQNIKKPIYICLIYSTAPLLLPKDLIESYKIIKNTRCKSVFSAVKNSYPVQRSFFLNKKKQITMLNKNNYYVRSQDLPTTYHDAGAFSWGTYKYWMNSEIAFNKNSKFYLLPQLRVQDIDNLEDLKVAKKLYKLLPTSKKEDQKCRKRVK